MRARTLLAAALCAGTASAGPARFAPRREGVVACTCTPTLVRVLPRGLGRALVVAAKEGPLAVMGAPVSGPSVALQLGSAGLRAGALVAVDVDLDGEVDLFVPSAVDGAPAALFVAKGAGFVDEAATRLPPLAGEVRAATWGDLDGDGLADLVVAREGGVELLTNDGAGKFVPADADRLPPVGDATPQGEGVFDVLAIDLDQDLDLDLVVLRQHGRGRVLLNDGKGAFTERAGGVPPTGAASTVAADFADLDGSGVLDLLLTGAPVSGGSPLAPLLGPAFDERRHVVDAPSEDRSLRTIDATGDGVLDVIAVSRSAPGLRLLLATPSGLRAEEGAFGAWGQGPPPVAVEVGDFDLDGAPDVFGARSDGTTFFYGGVPAPLSPPRSSRGLRQGAVTRHAPGEPVTFVLALRDVTRASSERPFERVEVVASVADVPVAPTYVRHIGGDLVRVELPALDDGVTLRAELHFPDARGDDLVVGPLDLPIGGAGEGAAEPPAAPGEPPAPTLPPSHASAWSCAVEGGRPSWSIPVVGLALAALVGRRRAALKAARGRGPVRA